MGTGERRAGRRARRLVVGRPTSAVKFGSVVVSFCTAEVGRRESSQPARRESTDQQKDATLTGCRFYNGFYASSPKTCSQERKDAWL